MRRRRRALALLVGSIALLAVGVLLLLSNVIGDSDGSPPAATASPTAGTPTAAPSTRPPPASTAPAPPTSPPTAFPPAASDTTDPVALITAITGLITSIGGVLGSYVAIMNLRRTMTPQPTAAAPTTPPNGSPPHDPK